MWVYPDTDMSTYASALSTADNVNNDNFQIADNGSNGIVAITENKSQWLEGGDIARDNWTHVVAVKYADNNSLAFYINGALGVNNMLSCPTNKKDSCADNNSLTTFDTNWEKIKIGINRVSQNHWKGYIDEVKVYGRALSATEVSNLYQNDTPSSTGTAWSKGLDFDGSSGYARSANDSSSESPLHRKRTDASPTLSDGAVTAGQTAATGQPWAVASVFNVSDLSSVRNLWSQAQIDSHSGNRPNDERAKLEIQANGKIRLFYGNESNYLKWVSSSSLISANNWYGIYVDYNGGTTGNTLNGINNNWYYSRFRIKLVDLSNGQVSDPTGTWSESGYGTVQDVVAGYFYVGSYGPYSSGANRFQGKISSTVTTTLKVGTALPDDTEVSLMVRDPMGWLSNYKVGNSWRKPNETAATTNFALGAHTGEQGTKIWLMGDGTNDSSSNIANQVNNSESNQYLQLNSVSTTSVSIPGL